MADESFDYMGVMKKLLGVDDSSIESVLQLYLDIAMQSILNYCNINELPSALNYTVCELACDAYRVDKIRGGTNLIVGNVSSITEDGRKVDFGDSTYIKSYVTDRVTKIRQLHRFKKLYRVSNGL